MSTHKNYWFRGARFNPSRARGAFVVQCSPGGWTLPTPSTRLVIARVWSRISRGIR